MLQIAFELMKRDVMRSTTALSTVFNPSQLRKLHEKFHVTLLQLKKNYGRNLEPGLVLMRDIYTVQLYCKMLLADVKRQSTKAATSFMHMVNCLGERVENLANWKVVSPAKPKRYKVIGNRRLPMKTTIQTPKSRKSPVRSQISPQGDKLAVKRRRFLPDT